MDFVDVVDELLVVCSLFSAAWQTYMNAIACERAEGVQTPKRIVANRSVRGTLTKFSIMSFLPNSRMTMAMCAPGGAMPASGV
jgi:hypothetical protein